MLIHVTTTAIKKIGLHISADKTKIYENPKTDKKFIFINSLLRKY